MSKNPLQPTVGRFTDAALRRRVRHLENANQYLLKELAASQKKLADATGGNVQQMMDELVDQLNKLSQDREPTDSTTARERPKSSGSGCKNPPQSGHGPRAQPSLPGVEVTYSDLAPGEDRCKACGGEMVPLGEQFEEHEEISVIELQYVRKTIKQRKWRCRCNGCVRTAPAPPRLIPGGRYDLDFAIHVAVGKYGDHLPLERQSSRMARQGLIVGSQTLWDQILALAKALGPTYEALGWEVLRSELIHVDETSWPFLKKGRSTWNVWTRSTDRIAHYAILTKKNTRVARQLFKGYRGILVADGFAVYEKLVKDDKDDRLELVNCWAHVLRKFRAIEKDFPTPCGEILELLGKLYKIERKVPGPFPGDSEARALRSRLRAKESQPIVDQIKRWAEVQVGLPRSDLGKAVKYMYKRWKTLTRFLDNPIIPLDNNLAERSLRGPVVGRKIHYGSKSKAGTRVAALFYTLLETAKLWNVNPTVYLKTAAERALAEPGAVTFPWELAEVSATAAPSSH